MSIKIFLILFLLIVLSFISGIFISSLLNNYDNIFNAKEYVIEEKPKLNPLKILCWFPVRTTDGQTIKEIMENWGPICSTVLLFGTANLTYPHESNLSHSQNTVDANEIAHKSTISLNTIKKRRPYVINLARGWVDNYGNLGIKVWSIWKFLYQNYNNEGFDWFIKLDPDSYVIPENLQNHLKKFQSDLPFFIGNIRYARNRPYLQGVTHILSKQTFKMLGSELIKERISECTLKYWTITRAEDVTISDCLYKLNIFPVYDKDVENKYLFYNLKLQDLHNEEKNQTSPHLIAFHYAKPFQSHSIKWNSGVWKWQPKNTTIS
jgi:hypothetical protein